MMTLYSGTTDPYSHRCRIVLYEKGMDFQVIDVDLANKPEDLAVINPYNQVPVLVERDLVLSEANIINEYIDERFPHPQLMPPDPVMRARARLFLYNFEKELFDHIKDIESDNEELADKARKTIADNLTQLVPIFSKQNYLPVSYTHLDVYKRQLGTCTHLGCSPAQDFLTTADWDGGFICACHGSKFDLAGRVFKGSPAPTNLVIPKHQYLTETTLLVGEDKESA